MPENITTAVDTLVKLVNNKGKISVDDASKELGIPANILNEWATFLDQEKIIHIEYKFTTPYLTATKTTKIEEKEKTKTTSDTIDLIIRRLSITLNFIIKSEPKDDKGRKQRDYLIRRINEFVEDAKRGKVNKNELEKLVEYYKIYKSNL
jgi:DNA-binding transcriptional regulator YhcF (GntR family)